MVPSTRAHSPAATEERAPAALGGGRRKQNTEVGWDGFSSNGSGTGATRSHRHAGKTKGCSKLSELPGEILDPAAGRKREGPWARTRHRQSRERQKQQESSSGVHPDERGENCSVCSRNRTASEGGTYSPFPPSFHTLSWCFLPENKWSSWLESRVS